nr:MAG TPA: hypothetical protein [Caudoviricetes sp.]
MIMYKLKLYYILFLILILFSGIGIYKYKQYINTLNENKRLKTNIEFYENRANRHYNSNVVLQHTVAELKNSKDSLIQKINSLQKELKLKPKNVKTIVYTETVLRDTLRDTISVDVNFRKVLKPNEQTAIEVIRQDSSLTVIPNIQNNQTLFIHNTYQYKYKHWFSRLIHFNFSKTQTTKYTIKNSNDLIKINDSRVINME